MNFFERKTEVPVFILVILGVLCLPPLFTGWTWDEAKITLIIFACVSVSVMFVRIMDRWLILCDRIAQGESKSDVNTDSDDANTASRLS